MDVYLFVFYDHYTVADSEISKREMGAVLFKRLRFEGWGGSRMSCLEAPRIGEVL